MPLFKVVPFGKSKSGQLQEVYCPRCKSLLRGDEDSTTINGDGVALRKVTGEYKCLCNYEVTVIEKYPVINRAPSREI